MNREPTYKELKKQNEFLQLELDRATDQIKQAQRINEKANSRIHYLESTLDQLDTYIYIKDNQKKYVYANKKTLKFFECTDNELKGSDDSSYFPKETVKVISKIDDSIIKLGENTNFEVESKDNDGNRLVFLEIKSPLFDKNDKNKIVGLCGISTDITERKKQEDAIKENHLQLKLLNKTKDKLFSIIAHDLRSPFYGINGLSELLIENLNNTENEEAKEYIFLINSLTKNTLTLLDNLLTWAKSQTKELYFNPEKITLSEEIVEVITLKKSISKAKNISLSYSPKDKIELYTDKNILQTILRNLISNAIKFTHVGGNVNISVTTNKELIEISVSDNGVGMSEETISKIFDLSNNTPLPGTNNEQGSGLGLVLCKELVEKLGGKFWVESKVENGSDFRFTLPMSISE
ncbi:PAS domain-containing sensor histidine kinase [uncultured Dokdonia sp.]|uniref:PAS domain-containing sensor histidine kinase n=1 Tax=uncultured Dokdonia sp. TaxID=575653 RepID=UPI00263557DB|nr:PAS domain-containing sensor histidine kinase [uncultured Dokdonia sp.]